MSLQTAGLKFYQEPVSCNLSLSQLCVKTLVDLRKLEPRCGSKSRGKLMQLIGYHKMEALEPAEEACRNKDEGPEIRRCLGSLGNHMK